MRYSIFTLIFLALLSLNCVKQSATQTETVNATALLFENTPIAYPMGNSLNPENDVMRWGNLPESEQEQARKISNKLTIDAIRLSGKIMRNMDFIEDDEIPSLILKAKTIFEDHKESKSLLLAQQMFAMKVQEGLFENFIHTRDIEVFENAALSKNEIELLRYATSLNLESGNSNADLALINLQILKNTLKDAEFRELKELAVSNAENWYQTEFATCSTCKEKTYSVEMTKKERVYRSVQSLKTL